MLTWRSSSFWRRINSRFKNCSPGPAILLAISCAIVARAEERAVSDARELKRAIGDARPGDVLRLKPGRWPDLQVVIDCNGTANQPITIAAPDTRGVIVEGNSRLRIGGAHLVVRNLDFQNAWHSDAIIEFRADSKRLAQHSALVGCTFRDCNPPQLTMDTQIISIYGQDNRVTECTIDGKRNSGPTLVVWLAQGAVRHLIDHNRFGPRRRMGYEHEETMRIGDSRTSLVSAQCRIEDNEFVECSGEAEIISNKSCDNVYLRNIFRRCSGALTLRHGHRCRVEGNQFFGESVAGSGGVRIIGEDHIVANNLFVGLRGTDMRAALGIMNGLEKSPMNGYSPVKRAKVLFNTFVDCRQSVLIGVVDRDNVATVPPVECQFIGNIVSSRSAPLVQFLDESSQTVWEGNCFWGGSTDDRLGSDRLQADPLLVADTAGVFRPSANSPVIGGFSRALNDIQIDIDGHRRTLPWDIGCDQFNSQPGK